MNRRGWRKPERYVKVVCGENTSYLVLRITRAHFRKGKRLAKWAK